MTNRRWLTGALIVALVVPTVAATGDVRYVRCESGAFGRYRECRVRTEGQVELVRELSFRRCVAWRTWGFDREGVWVDKGCRAEFRVGRDGGGAAGAAVIGAVAGAAILGAILGNRNEPGPPADIVAAPDWALGRFHGFSPKMNSDFDLTIDAKGTVGGTADGKPITGHFAAPDMLHLGDMHLSIAREDWGFSAKDADDPDNVIYMRRQ